MLNILGKIFGTKNDKEIKKYKKRVEQITALEDKYKAYSDEELQTDINNIKTDIQAGSKTTNDVLNDVFPITKEASTRVLNMRHYDVQLIVD